MSHLKRALATTLATGTVLLAATAPAQAALDLYADANYRGWLGSFSQAMTTHHNMSTNANDALTSFRNYTPYSAAFWHDSNRAGRCFSAAPGDVNSGLGFWDNDKVSSFQLGRAC